MDSKRAGGRSVDMDGNNVGAETLDAQDHRRER